jgi:hypothetical protein
VAGFNTLSKDGGGVSDEDMQGLEKEIEEIKDEHSNGIDRMFPFGPTCICNGIEVPEFVTCSKNGSIIRQLLTNMLQRMDALMLFDRSNGINNFLLCDGHGSRYDEGDIVADNGKSFVLLLTLLLMMLPMLVLVMVQLMPLSVLVLLLLLVLRPASFGPAANVARPPAAARPSAPRARTPNPTQGKLNFVAAAAGIPDDAHICTRDPSTIDSVADVPAIPGANATDVATPTKIVTATAVISAFSIHNQEDGDDDDTGRGPTWPKDS